MRYQKLPNLNGMKAPSINTDGTLGQRTKARKGCFEKALLHEKVFLTYLFYPGKPTTSMRL